MQIFVKSTVGEFSEEPISLDVEPNDTIENVKAEIQEKTGIPTYVQRLVCKGRPMEDGRTVADYNVVDGDTLYLVIRSHLDDQ